MLERFLLTLGVINVVVLLLNLAYIVVAGFWPAP